MSEVSRSLDRKPRVLVTRAAGQASALAEELRRLGAEPVVVPILEILPPASFEKLDEALADMTNFDWLLFTSANAVHGMAARANDQGLPLSFEGVKIAAIGAATGRAIELLGQRVDLMPGKAVAESLIESLLPFARQPEGRRTRFLLLRALEGRDLLPKMLTEAGGDVTIAPVYETRVPTSGIDDFRNCFEHLAGPPAAVTLTSSSTARNFFAMLTAASVELTGKTCVASIGPITSATLRELGRAPDVESPEASVRMLAKTVMDYLGLR